MNDLDRAIMALSLSKSALPELMRRLGEGELWFLTPYHPEVEGEVIELKNGMALPFAQFQDKEGVSVALFSSLERADEARKKARFPARTYSMASMSAKLALEIIGKAELRALLNKGCKTGAVTLPADLMRAIADGSALQSDEATQPRIQETVSIINPADYPTDLTQPAFEILRQHRNFRAAWIVERHKGKPTAAGGRTYQFLVLMDPRDAVIFKEFNIVVQNARACTDEVNLGYLDENDAAEIARIWDTSPPFYTAPDYVRPPSAKKRKKRGK